MTGYRYLHEPVWTNMNQLINKVTNRKKCLCNLLFDYGKFIVVCTLLGPRQTSDFDEQYCDIAIKHYCNKAIIFVTKAIFLWQNIAIAFQNQLKNPWIEIFNSHGEKKYCQKNVFLSQYRFIFLSQYCLSKSLVWRGP
jgi:hypothetical protein